MWLAIDPATDNILCRDGQFRSNPDIGKGKECAKTFKLQHNALSASNRLGTPTPNSFGLQTTAITQRLQK